MIGYIKGTILDITEDTLLVQNNGVGYVVNTPYSMDFNYGAEVELYTYTHVKEEDLSLWGFPDPKELKLFKLLISVSGIGPRTAISIFRQKNYEAIVRSIMAGDYKQLKVSGVGEKTAQKIIFELKEKVVKLGVNPYQKTSIEDPSGEVGRKFGDVREALTGLGYGSNEINEFLYNLANLSEKTEKEIVQLFLKEYAKRS